MISRPVNDSSHPVSSPPESLEIAAPAHVLEMISRIGRTEDIRFSPENRRVAIAGFGRHSCLVFNLEVDRSGALPVIRIADYVEIRSGLMEEPHGLEFIGESLLLVANRIGNVSLFEIPDISRGERVRTLEPVRTLRKAGLTTRLRTPGSLCLVEVRNRRAEILVCNNYRHRVSRHVFPLTPGRFLTRNSIVLEKGLQIPDGITLSPDKRWVAISNHQTNSVLIFDRRTKLNRTSVAAGTLSGVAFPHGIRFSNDGQRLYVADAGAPLVHVYEANETDWQGNRFPTRSLTILSDECFLRGRISPEEGGPKGIDLSSAEDLIAITCEEMPLAFFHLQGGTR